MDTSPSLLIRLRDTNDNDSWAEFFTVYAPFIEKYAHMMGLDRQHAPDIVSEVLIICVRQMPDFEYNQRAGAFRAWLRTVTQNAVKGLWKKQKRQAGEPLGEGIEPAVDNWDELWDQEHRQHILKTTLPYVREKTNAKTWQCFELHILQRQPAAEVATQLGLKTNAVFVNASRVLERIRVRCREFDEELCGE